MKLSYKIFILLLIMLLNSSYLYSIQGDNNYTFRSKTFSAANQHYYYHQLEMNNVNWEYNQTEIVKQTFVVTKDSSSYDYQDSMKLNIRIESVNDEIPSLYDNSSEYFPGLVIANNSESAGNYTIDWMITPQQDWPDILEFYIHATWKETSSSPKSNQDIYGGYLVATIILNSISTETETVTEVSNNTITETSSVTNTVTDTSTTTEYQTETVSNINNITQYETNNVTMISTVTETLSPDNEDAGPQISTDVTLNYQLLTIFVLIPATMLYRKFKQN